MKAGTVVTLLTLTLASFAPLGYAAESGSFSSQMAQHLKQDLALSDDQVTKIQDVLKNYEPKREDAAAAKERMDKMHSEISSILTDDQKAKFTELQNQRHSRGRRNFNGQGRGDWNGQDRHWQGQGKGREPWNKMTDAQKKEIQQKRESFWNNLTDDQKAQLKQRHEQGREHGDDRGGYGHQNRHHHEGNRGGQR